MGVDLREFDLQRLAGDIDRVDDALHRLAQRADVARLARDDLLPVPLVDIDRVQIVHDLVAPDRVHIGDQPLARADLIAAEGIALPLCEGMHHLRLRADIGNVKRDGALVAVQIIIQAGSLLDKQRRRHAQQIQCTAKVFLEIVLDVLNGTLRLIDRKRVLYPDGI